MEQRVKHPGGRPSNTAICIDGAPDYPCKKKQKKRKPAKVLTDILSDKYIEWFDKNYDQLFPEDQANT